VLDPRRKFSRQEVWRAWQRQGNVCNLCGRGIPFDLIVGDHIVPWIRGGPTTLQNLQALCGSCNLRKGSDPQEVAAEHFDLELIAPSRVPMRKWQTEAMPTALGLLGREVVLIEACPGAGKTRFGLEVAYALVAKEAISRVLIVVPTLAIADGWQRAASSTSMDAPTLPLRTQREWRPVDPIGDGWLGAIVTYHSLFRSTEMFLAHATDPGHRTLVIFDEVHHAGTDAAWGASAQAAFAQGAWGILALTGTPFRTDRSPIVFVPSEGGSARPHFRYGYDQAIEDGSCRPIQFVEVRGQTTFRTEDGVVHSVSFDDTEVTQVGERRRLRAAIEWMGDGSVAGKLLDDANRYLLALRKQGDRDAAGLVVCIDCDHAARVASYMGDKVLGRRPIVACSRLYDPDDPDPANAVRLFRTSHEPWIVAVNMVSEGVDIPRLRAVVYLTNRLTLLSFRQIVGRVVRTDTTNAGDHGRVYLPADPTLLEMARSVREEAPLLPPPVVIVTDDNRTREVRIEGEERRGASPFETIETLGEQGGVFDTAGREAQSLLIACARRFIDREGLTGTDPESLALVAAENPELRTALLELRPDR
jgi:superfamily II DNA or RNA helicase